MNVQTIYLQITSVTANVQQTASVTSGTMINETDVAYCMRPQVCLNQAPSCLC